MELNDYFETNPKVALAFSGGVDSSYLLYAAIKSNAQVKAYYVKSAFQPEFEYKDAMRLVEELGAEVEVIEVDVLSSEEVIKNPSNRCYYCKRRIFDAILGAASKDGFTLIIDGTNASDDVADRPGMKALKELEVQSPLRICGLTKNDVRMLSKSAGLFTWDKPSYACLATRIKTGEEITLSKLERTEKCEEYLKSLGFTDFRIRTQNDEATLEVTPNDLNLVIELKEEILGYLKNHYKKVLLNLEVRTHE